jgi:type VI protein secretion system component Hcp
MFIANRYLASMILGSLVLAAMPCASLADFPQGLSMTVIFCDMPTSTCDETSSYDFKFPALAVNFGVTKQAAISNSAPGAAKPSFENLMIEKILGGPESPALFLGAAQGTTWPQVKVDIKEQNSSAQPPVAWVSLYNAQIPSYKTMINTNTATELVELSFSRICLTTFDPTIEEVCWDVFKNQSR